MIFRSTRRWLMAALVFLVPWTSPAETARETIAKAIVTEDSEEQAKLVSTLVGSADPQVPLLLNAWKGSNLYIYEVTVGEGDDAKTTRTAVQLEDKQDADSKQLAHRVENNAVITDDKGAPLPLLATDLTSAETDSNVRGAMKEVLDLAALSSANPTTRRNAVTKLGMSQEVKLLEPLEARLKIETNSDVKDALREAIDLIHLKSEDPEVQKAAASDLGVLTSISSRDALEQLRKDSAAESAVGEAATGAISKINAHLKIVNAVGTVFRGASLGSVLLIMAVGLAITFGVMGVINMAHGELIAVGAYTTYVVQNIFASGMVLPAFGLSIKLPGLNMTGLGADLYFLCALPVSFLVAAGVGILLERSVIRFLYKRPLESLLATWGVSLVFQQILRLTFGANNVQVSSPSYLSGNWTVFDIVFGWNRLFVIGFAFAILIGTILLLTRTPLGLLIRAVTQNRAMASCMGVRTERVNMLTFGFGSGLAGLAGAFYSQLGNVGPSMGQDHIVNAFMTVVVGGLGSLVGTVVSAVGIGVADQSMQTLLEPDIGKILVLMAIIVFFMWRPSGLFVTKSRNLES